MGAQFRTGFLRVLPRHLINQRLPLWSHMSRFLSTVALFLMSSHLFAALREVDAASAPAETVSVVWVIVFCVVFVVSCVGFFAYIWMKDDKSEHVKSDK